jgi:hypothetical protein
MGSMIEDIDIANPCDFEEAWNLLTTFDKNIPLEIGASTAPELAALTTEEGKIYLEEKLPVVQYRKILRKLGAWKFSNAIAENHLQEACEIINDNSKVEEKNRANLRDLIARWRIEDANDLLYLNHDEMKEIIDHFKLIPRTQLNKLLTPKRL